MQQELSYALGALSGIIFHSLLKYQSLRDDKERLGGELLFKMYLKKDWPGIVMSSLVPVMWYLAYGEIAAKYAVIQNFVISSFIMAGAIGSYGFQLLMSRVKKEIKNQIGNKSKSNTMDDAQMEYLTAMDKVLAGEYVKRVDWTSLHYLFLSDGSIMEQMTTGNYHVYNPSESDQMASDWVGTRPTDR